MLKRKTPLRRVGRLKRVPMKRKNTHRAAKRRAECFGEQAELCRSLLCVACSPGDKWTHAGVSDPHHEPPRSVGGKDGDTVPLCRAHHDERHCVGRAAFERKYGVDLRGVARAIREELGK